MITPVPAVGRHPQKRAAFANGIMAARQQECDLIALLSPG